ncbi:hypothetical protein CRM22_009154 [Opisthorchis felineus]|uniref:MD-2-related lipid-recognition domain-containing protein n=1 Tax=Opisthorchis felineus TaxID=147828 RepID=A0A4S2L7Y6_OPIFE|nr:hypothetical protein CRM22_009154 [Opisthorchis felineus]
MIWWMQLLIIVVCGAILHLPEFVDAVDFADCGSTGAIVVSVDVFPCNNDPCTLVKGALTTFTVNFVARKWQPLTQCLPALLRICFHCRVS